MTNYTPSYTSGNLAEVVVDFVVEFGVQILAFAGLIALILLFVWVKGAMRK